MLKIKSILAVLILMCSCLILSTQANAQVNVFTDHQVVSMFKHGVNENIDVPFPTGKYPYIGRVGVEYEFKRVALQIGYIHRSNVDITSGNEYNYDGGFVGIRFRQCIYSCK